MKRKVLIAITGASGSIYADLLLKKLHQISDQWEELSLVMTTNAKEVWKIELDNEEYLNYKVKYFSQEDFNAPFASGSGQ